MLRNVRHFHGHFESVLLNEVLSLNAQEFVQGAAYLPIEWILNEVLSLNAQE